MVSGSSSAGAATAGAGGAAFFLASPPALLALTGELALPVAVVVAGGSNTPANGVDTSLRLTVIAGLGGATVVVWTSLATAEKRMTCAFSSKPVSYGLTRKARQKP